MLKISKPNFINETDRLRTVMMQIDIELNLIQIDIEPIVIQIDIEPIFIKIDIEL